MRRKHAEARRYGDELSACVSMWVMTLTKQKLLRNIAFPWCGTDHKSKHKKTCILCPNMLKGRSGWPTHPHFHRTSTSFLQMKSQLVLWPVFFFLNQRINPSILWWHPSCLLVSFLVGCTSLPFNKNRGKYSSRITMPGLRSARYPHVCPFWFLRVKRDYSGTWAEVGVFHCFWWPVLWWGQWHRPQ